MKPRYETAIFKSHKNGFYTFTLDNGVDMDFEEIHPQILMKFDLKHDKNLINKVFHLAYSDDIVDDEDDFIIFRIEYLELINAN
ncbi:hypothetical protein [Ichthyenterobacterium magnum]|uniref:Uncharacterized protein n=1 Tax=Ichthyenterobacterium magnum TaxID=1230530 RepID=A0A420DM83_9FLAO|nr:hypothetical protein [Ichthyenterobacterium magnum]RKE95352.1 hypothetical protein BXY80_1539 [Ichthyenterobacterium magnum]